MAFDAQALYDEVKSGRLSVDKLSPEGLKIYKQKEKELAKTSKKSASPANAGGAPASKMFANSTPSAKPNTIALQEAFKMASPEFKNEQLAQNNIYTGTPPVQANAGNIQRSTVEDVKRRQQALNAQEAKRLANTQPQPPAEEAPKTWGSQLDDFLSQSPTYQGLKYGAQKTGEALMSNPYTGVPLTALGAGAQSLQDYIASKTTPSEIDNRTSGQIFGQQLQNMNKAGAEYLKEKGVTGTGLGALSGFGITDFGNLIQRSLGGVSQRENAPLDITKNIYAQTAMATRGLTAEQALKEADEQVRKNPNLYGTSSNIIGLVADPLNVPIGGALSKVGRALSKAKVAETVAPAIEAVAKTPKKYTMRSVSTQKLPATEQQSIYDQIFQDMMRKEKQSGLESTFGGDLTPQVQRDKVKVVDGKLVPEPKKYRIKPVVQSAPEPKKYKIKPILQPTSPSGFSLDRAGQQALYENLMAQSENNPELKKIIDRLETAKAFDNLPEYYQNISNKHSEIDTEIKTVRDQIDELNNEHNKNIQDLADGLWERYKAKGSKPADSLMMEAVKKYGYVKTPVKGDFFYEAYKTIPDTLKRKYFRKDTKYAIDEFANDAFGISADDLLNNLEYGKEMLLPEDQWIQDFVDMYGHKPTKQKLAQFVKEQGDMTGAYNDHYDNVQSLQSVIDELKNSKSELPKIPVEQSLGEKIKTDLKPKTVPAKSKAPLDEQIKQDLAPKTKGKKKVSVETAPTQNAVVNPVEQPTAQNANTVQEIEQQIETVTNIRDNEVINAKRTGANPEKVSRKYNKQLEDLKKQEEEVAKATPQPLGEQIAQDLGVPAPRKSRAQARKEAELKAQQEREAKIAEENVATVAKQDRIIKQIPDIQLQKLALANKEDVRFSNELARRGRENTVVRESEGSLGDKVAKFFGAKTSIEDKINSPEFKTMFKENKYPDALFEDFKQLFKDLDDLEKEYIDVELLDTPNTRRAKEYASKQQSLWDAFNQKEKQLSNKGSSLGSAESRIDARNAEFNKSQQSKLGAVAGAKIPAVPTMDVVADIGKALGKKTEQEVAVATQEAKRFEGLRNFFKAFPKATNIVREKFFKGERDMIDAPNKAEKLLRKITAPIGRVKGEFDLFVDTIILRDFKETLERDPSAKLPDDLTLQQVTDALDQVEKQVGMRDNIKKALDNYYDVMREIGDDLAKRGLIPANDMRQFYFPHKVLQHFDENLATASGKGLDSPFRNYTLKRKGSTSIISRDFEKVIRGTLEKFYKDNAIEDTMNSVLDLTDVLKDIKPNEVTRGAKNVAYATKPVGQMFSEFKKDIRTELKALGVPEEEMQTVVEKLWKKTKENPSIGFKLINGGRVVIDGKPYVFFSPRYKNTVALIPEEIAGYMKDFGQPLAKNKALLGFIKGNQIFKSTALTINFLPRIATDISLNALKTLYVDPAAFMQAPRAFRLMLRNSDVGWLEKVGEAIKKIQTQKSVQLDNEIEQILKQADVIEPIQLVKGVYSYTPAFKNFMKRALSLGTHSANITQKLDETFKAMKFSSDYSRLKASGKMDDIQKGKLVKSDGMVDTSGLDPLESAVKVANEFYVNPKRQSKRMRMLTSTLLPFANWIAVDTLHMLRAFKNHPLKYGAIVGGTVAGMEVWNNTGERKQIEQNLPPAKRQMPHVITGFLNDAGEPIIIYLPILPGSAITQITGASYLPQNASDVATGKKTVEEASQDLGADALKASIQGATGLVSPLVKTVPELALNRSSYTGKDIVPSNKKFTSEGAIDLANYVGGQLVPPYRSLVQSPMKELDKAEQGKQTASDALVNTLDKLLNPKKRFVETKTSEELKKDKAYYDVEKKNRINNALKIDLKNSLADALITGDTSKAKEIRKKLGMDRQSYLAFRRENMKDIITRALGKTDDPKIIAELQNKLNGIDKKNLEELFSRAGE